MFVFVFVFVLAVNPLRTALYQPFGDGLLRIDVGFFLHLLEGLRYNMSYINTKLGVVFYFVFVGGRECI